MEQITDVLTYIPKKLGLIKIQKENIDEIINKLEDLDILLFSGKDFWFSYLVEYSSWSDFSHTGIILRSPTWIDESLTDVYLLESGAEPKPDPIDHKIKFGVQLTPLKQLIEGYDGNIYYRKMNSSSFKENPQYYYDKLTKIHEIIHDKPYDTDPLDLIRVEFRIDLGDCRKTNEFFCSALVAFIYTQLGFLPTDTQWDLVLPKDFNVGYKADLKITTQGLGTLGPLVKIK